MMRVEKRRKDAPAAKRVNWRRERGEVIELELEEVVEEDGGGGGGAVLGVGECAFDDGDGALEGWGGAEADGKVDCGGGCFQKENMWVELTPTKVRWGE